MKTETHMAHAFEDFIREVGAPNGLISDNARSETGKAVRDLCRMYKIAQTTTEPGHPEQNPCERHTSRIKPMMENLQRESRSPGNAWVLLIQFTIALLNVLAVKSLGWRTPTEVAFGRLPHISPFLQFRWWEAVMFEATGSFPSTVRSGYGRFVGIAEHSGPTMTFLMLTDDTLRVVLRSNVLSMDSVVPPSLPSFLQPEGEDSDAADEENVATNVLNDDETVAIDNRGPVPTRFFTATEADDILLDQIAKKKCPLFSPAELIGRTFIREMDDGQKMRAQICDYIETRENKLHAKTSGFLVQVGDELTKELISYNELLDLVERQMDAELRGDPDVAYTYTEISGHEGPLRSGDPMY